MLLSIRGLFMNKKEYKTLINYILKNDGATLDAGGAFISLSAGYVVSVAGYNLKLKKITALKLKTFNKLLTIAKNNGLYVGVWYNRAGRYYDIDLNIITADMLTAFIKARANKQRAIYDIKNNNSILINY